jgi:hypothetical protein
MNKRVYYAPDIDMIDMGQMLADWLAGQEFETQQMVADNGGVTIQARKESTLRMLAGMSSALSIVVQPEGENLAVEMGNAKWVDKGAVAAVGALVFWPALVTAGVGAYQQNQLMTQAWRKIEEYMGTNSAYGNRIAGPISQPGTSAPAAPATPTGGGTAAPPPPINMAAGGAPSAASATCPQCGHPLREGAKFCDNCGSPTSASCPNCGKALRPGARFCDECGAPAG